MTRVDVFDPENKRVVKQGDCVKSGNTHDIKRDFESSCPTIVDSKTGKSTKGFKYYTFISGVRTTLSECEWDNSDAIDFDVFNDFDACGFEKAVVDVEKETYNPAHKQYTIIDGVRTDLTSCMTSNDIKRPLPTKVESCDNDIDLANETVYGMERTDVYDPENKAVLKVGICAKDGNTTAISKDFDSGCTTKIDKSSGKFTKGYKYYAQILQRQTYHIHIH